MVQEIYAGRYRPAWDQRVCELAGLANALRVNGFEDEEIVRGMQEHFRLGRLFPPRILNTTKSSKATNNRLMSSATTRQDRYSGSRTKLLRSEI